MELDRLIAERAEQLTAAERRAADVVLSRPQVVAFGTVAELAATAGTSGATVVRLAAKLGFDGFTALQAVVQRDLGRKLRPAAERIRQPSPTDVVGRTAATELDNVQATLDAVDRELFATAADLLADTDRQVLVLSGEASRGVAIQVVTELTMLRDGVQMLDGSEVGVLRSLALARRDDVVLVIDLRRYERWVLETANRARQLGLHLLALTDSPLSPLSQLSDASFVVAASGAGPFDSHVGTLALLNAMVAAVADRHRSGATDRLDRLERAWSEWGALIDP
ncbi:MAG: MurR/RpiR family transcriptional regulator [Acidimicrobiia bacterium]